VVVEDNRDHR